MSSLILVQTGRTLQENGLIEVEEILQSTARRNGGQSIQPEDQKYEPIMQLIQQIGPIYHEVVMERWAFIAVPPKPIFGCRSTWMASAHCAYGHSFSRPYAQ